MLTRNSKSMRHNARSTKTPAKTAARAPAPAPTRSSFEQLEERRLMANSGFDLGININESSTATMNKAIPVLKELGIKTVRVWTGVSDFNDHRMQGSMQRAIDYSNAGFDVMLIVSPRQGKIPSPSAVKGWFEWATDNSALKNAVDRWQIGNEVDQSHYWQGSLKQYVNGLLKPAAEVLHDEGEKVVSAGPSWNPQDVQEMIDHGMLDHVDYVGVHPYAKGVRLQNQRIDEVNAVVKGRKPLVATEWNIRGYENDKSKWSEAVNDAYGQVRDGFAMNYYFGLLNISATPAGPGGIMNRDGSKTPFFYALQDAMKDDGVSNPTPKPTPTPTPGNTPSSLPRVVKLSLYNADTDQLVKGYDTLNNGDVIDVSKIGTSNLAIVATGASGTQSVKFNLNGTTYTESTGRYSIFGDNGRSNIYGKKFEADTYTLSATAYSRDGATGTAGRTQTLSFTVQGNDGETPTKPTPTQPTTPTKPGNTGGYASLKGFQLINAATGEVIKGYENITSSTTIKLSSLPTRKLALVAVASGNTQSIKLTAMGKKRIENDAPFAFLGGTDKKLNSFYAWAGNYSFSATAYSKDNAGGAKGENITLKIKFT